MDELLEVLFTPKTWVNPPVHNFISSIFIHGGLCILKVSLAFF